MPPGIAILVALPMAVMVAALVVDRAMTRAHPGSASGPEPPDAAGGPAGGSALTRPLPNRTQRIPHGRAPAPRGGAVAWRVRPRLRLVRRPRSDLAGRWLARLQAMGIRVEVCGVDGLRVRGRVVAHGRAGVVIAGTEPLLLPRSAIWTVRPLAPQATGPRDAAPDPPAEGPSGA